jgi:hypothetical protein
MTSSTGLAGRESTCRPPCLLNAVKELDGRRFNAYPTALAFRYDMHIANEVSGPIGTSTLFAAWNAAIYVAQIEDDRLSDVKRRR